MDFYAYLMTKIGNCNLKFDRHLKTTGKVDFYKIILDYFDQDWEPSNFSDFVK